MYVCPVPSKYCSGTTVQVEPWKQRKKCHGRRIQVKRCARKYLENIGYTQSKTNSNEFIKPGQPVFVLSRKVGARLMPGKAGGEGIGSGRWMFRRRELIYDSVPLE